MVKGRKEHMTDTQVQVKQSVKTARTRRQRGYAWEDTIVKRLRKAGWKAFRLGSPSVGLPDIVATNTGLSIILAIEAKSGTSNTLAVPRDQIERCIRWLDAFDIYEKRYAILAFKFMSKKWKRVGEYEKRERKEYFKCWGLDKEPSDIVCVYDGSIYENGSRKSIYLEEYLPWAKAFNREDPTS